MRDFALRMDVPLVRSFAERVKIRFFWSRYPCCESWFFAAEVVGVSLTFSIISMIYSARIYGWSATNQRPKN